MRKSKYYSGPVEAQYYSFRKETKVNFQLRLSLGNTVEESLASEVRLKRMQQTYWYILLLENSRCRDSYKRLSHALQLFLSKKHCAVLKNGMVVN